MPRTRCLYMLVAIVVAAAAVGLIRVPPAHAATTCHDIEIPVNVDGGAGNIASGHALNLKHSRHQAWNAIGEFVDKQG